MSPDYDAAEAAWREAWRLARKAEAAAAGTAEQEAADAAFGLALSQMLEALGHPRAIRRAQLTDECVESVDRIAMAHRATLATTEGSPERDQANAETIATYVEFGRWSARRPTSRSGPGNPSLRQCSPAPVSTVPATPRTNNPAGAGRGCVPRGTVGGSHARRGC